MGKPQATISLDMPDVRVLGTEITPSGEVEWGQYPQIGTLVDFLRSIQKCLKKTIRTVCSDMYKGYIEAVREELKESQIAGYRRFLPHPRSHHAYSH